MGCLLELLEYAIVLLVLVIGLIWSGIQWGIAHLDIVIPIFIALLVIGLLDMYQYHPWKRRLTLLIACAVFYWILSRYLFYAAAAICFVIEIVMTFRQWMIILPARQFVSHLDAVGYTKSSECGLSTEQKNWLTRKIGYCTFQSTEYLISIKQAGKISRKLNERSCLPVSEIANITASVSGARDARYLELMIAYLESTGCLLQVKDANGQPAILTPKITAQLLAALDREGAATHTVFTQMCAQIFQWNNIPFSASITAKSFLNLLVRQGKADTIHIEGGDTLFILKNRSWKSKMTTVELAVD